MTSKETTAPPTENASPPSPGKRLAAARKERNLSLADIADALNLTENKIEALERDDYEEFAGRTYVRGYLLSYARHLLIDSDQIEREFAGFLPATNQARSDISRVQLDTASESPARRVALGLLALLLIMLVGYVGYSVYSGQNEQSALESPLINPPPTGSAAESVSNPIAARQEVLIGPLPLTEGVNSSNAQPATLIQTVISAPEADASAAEDSSPVTEPVEIVLEFIEESWADVRAADGSKLLYNLQPADSTIALTVELPVKLFLGNAAGVKIFYNGEPYDYPVRGRIAQFTLDAPAAPSGSR